MVKGRKHIVKNWQLLVLVIIIILTIIAGGYLYFRYEKNLIRSEKYEDLRTIARLKTEQITQWRKERLGDANIITHREFFRHSVEQFPVVKNDTKVKEQILDQMYYLKSQYGYENILLTSIQGEAVISLDQDTHKLDSITLDYLHKASAKQQATFTDFYRDSLNKIWLDVIAPFLNKKYQPFAFIILQIDPSDYLYPLIQTWPVASKSAETSLLRKDNGNILFLNELRHRKNTALNLQISLENKEFVGVKAALGSVGITEGFDYRHKKVIAFTHPVPDTPWIIVSKIDRNEIFSELRYRVIIIIAFVSLLIFLLGTGIGWIYQRRQRFIMIQDIRARRQAEEKFRKSEDRFRSTLDNMMEGCQIIGFDWKYIYLNNAADTHNRPKEELLGKKYMDMWPGIENTEVFRVIKHCMEERIPHHMENEFIFPDRTGGWFDLSIQPVPEGVFILSIDVSKRKLAEDALLDSEEKYRLISDNANDWVYWISPDGIFRYTSPSCERVTGYSPVDFVNNPKLIKDITYPEDRDIFNHHTEKIAKEGSPDNLEFRIITKTGEIRWISHSCSPIYTREGEYAGRRGTNRNITERKQAEEEIKKLNEELELRIKQRTLQLETVNKELETFTYSVSHDLKAPLRGIDGYSKLLLDLHAKSLDEEARTFISTIRSSTLQMNQLIDDLLEYSLLERSQMRKESIKIKQLITSIISLLRDDLNNGNFTVKMKIPDRELTADSKGLSIALRNLLENAIKFTRERSKPFIEIGMKEKTSSWKLYVKDNGIGFDMKYHQKIFEIFQRLHRAEDYPGTGIGLAMVNKAMQRMCGKTWAESTPDVGSTFYLELPKTI